MDWLNHSKKHFIAFFKESNLSYNEENYEKQNTMIIHCVFPFVEYSLIIFFICTTIHKKKNTEFN